MSKQLTDSESKLKQEDLDNRVKSFNGELIPLLSKYNLAIGAIPFISPDGKINANPHVFDDPKSDVKIDEVAKVE